MLASVAPSGGQTARLMSVGDVVVVALAVLVELLVWHGDVALVTGGALPKVVIPVLMTAVPATASRRSSPA